MKLYVGDLVLRGEEILQVTSLHPHGVDYIPEGMYSPTFAPYGELKGIPLSPDLLEPLGFVKKPYTLSGHPVSLFCNEDFALLWDPREPMYFYPLVEAKLVEEKEGTEEDYRTYGASALVCLHELRQCLWINFETEVDLDVLKPHLKMKKTLKDGPDQRN